MEIDPHGESSWTRSSSCRSVPGLDMQRRRIRLAGRPAIPFDVASLDAGSTVAGFDLPGVRERALPTRPIGAFVQLVEEVVTRAPPGRRGGNQLRLLIVGGGAAARGTLLSGGHRILADYPEGLVRRVLRRARYIGARGRAIGMRTFGASAPFKKLQNKFGFDPGNVAAAAREQLARKA